MSKIPKSSSASPAPLLLTFFFCLCLSSRVCLVEKCSRVRRSKAELMGLYCKIVCHNVQFIESAPSTVSGQYFVLGAPEESLFTQKNIGRFLVIYISLEGDDTHSLLGQIPLLVKNFQPLYQDFQVSQFKNRKKIAHIWLRYEKTHSGSRFISSLVGPQSS